MANSGWSEKVLQLLRRMNNFYLPGSCRAHCLRFEVDGAQVGWIPPHVAPLLTRYPDVFSPPRGGAVALCPGLDTYGRRSEAVDAVLQTLRQEDFLTCLRGWRDEQYSVMQKFSDPPVMWMERAATSLFGVKRYGVHLNGYTVGEGGEVSMWLARRSNTKQTYPGLLDNVVSPASTHTVRTGVSYLPQVNEADVCLQAAGGLAAGVGIKHTLIKECQEEACIPAAIAERAHPVTTVSYTYEDEEGVFAESQFVFDLELPLDFKPKVGDGEVHDFYLLPIEEVKDLIATEDFKPNCAMVVLDFLIRHSFIEPDTEPRYQDFVAALHQTL
ncbi:thiamin pyrophosphokinase 2 isoform X1 [Micropterus salmoides]|uniref:thiamin pyrophosphokinase 2 isoform X1 n=1 Tax=Micropterus salmoides TaxID=27706 RepID=UPI0018EE32E1|nr:thiamin pyrophosphokinase 2 isoform X1 [Micropterus salmoides]XP_038577556.1 thiamin pyrophosphokinase 2 isoform X1 [Micropterus salmoides]